MCSCRASWILKIEVSCLFPSAWQFPRGKGFRLPASCMVVILFFPHRIRQSAGAAIFCRRNLWTTKTLNEWTSGTKTPLGKNRESRTGAVVHGHVAWMITPKRDRRRPDPALAEPMIRHALPSAPRANHRQAGRRFGRLGRAESSIVRKFVLHAWGVHIIPTVFALELKD